jgi:hypothetical protein
MTYLGPVEFHVFRFHGFHAVAEVVAYPDRVWVRFEVVHGDGDVEVGGEEESEAARWRAGERAQRARRGADVSDCYDVDQPPDGQVTWKRTDQDLQ